MYYQIYIDKENGMEETIAFCRYVVDAKLIQKNHEDSMIKIANERNTREWKSQ